MDVCCIAALSRRRDGVYPRPTNSGQDTKQIPRSSEGGVALIFCLMCGAWYRYSATKRRQRAMYPIGVNYLPWSVVQPRLCIVHDQEGLKSVLQSRGHNIIFSRNRFLNLFYTIPIHAIWRCKTDRFIVQNGPFRVPKWTVLQRHLDRFGKVLIINGLPS